ncbi:MAG TPA: TetR/AcrR family transcriptional regulator [Ktedonobacteraceae bacterium]|nr:TetR/AcrR family transcriptional regulator [Ktedonobacteraceae bacterium]
MPFSRFARMPDEKRERLMIVAAQEFAANGFEAASFNRILEEAQIGKSSAYYYFEDKADLFCTVTQYCIDRLQLAPPDEEVSSLTAETFWSELARIHDQPLLRTLEQPWLFGVVRAAERLTRESLQRETLAQLARYLNSYIATNMGAMIKRGQELGLIRTDLPDDLLIAWFRAVDGASDNWLLAHLEQLDQEAITRISHQTIATIQHMLAPLV